MVEIPANRNCHSMSRVDYCISVDWLHHIQTKTNLSGTYYDAWMILENSPNKEAAVVKRWKILTWKSTQGNRATPVRARWLIRLTSARWTARFRISQEFWPRREMFMSVPAPHSTDMQTRPNCRCWLFCLSKCSIIKRTVSLLDISSVLEATLRQVLCHIPSYPRQALNSHFTP